MRLINTQFLLKHSFPNLYHQCKQIHFPYTLIFIIINIDKRYYKH